MNSSPAAGAKCQVSFTVNGEAKSVLAYPMQRLLDVLRNELGLTGTKEGCGEGECGSCSVLLDGMLVKKPEPTLSDIREGLAGNLCRCTGYMHIFEAVTRAARRRVAK